MLCFQVIYPKECPFSMNQSIIHVWILLFWTPWIELPLRLVMPCRFIDMEGRESHRLVFYYLSRAREIINMSHRDIHTNSRRHQHPCQFEWNREKARSPHSLNPLSQVLSHYQLHHLKSRAAGCWQGPHRACSALDLFGPPGEYTEVPGASGFKGRSISESFLIGEHSILFFIKKTGENPHRAGGTPSSNSSLQLRVKSLCQYWP